VRGKNAARQKREGDFMIFQRVNGSDAEKVFAIFYNVQGATLTANYATRLDTGTFDGVRVSQPTTGTFSLLVGIANVSIADSAYGLVQIYGYRSSAFVTNQTNTAIVAGDILTPVNGQNYLDRAAAGNGTQTAGTGLIIAGTAVATATTPAAAAQKVFIRCM